MKRDPRLRRLSAEHHHALVLARRLAELVGDGRARDAAHQLAERFDRELEPHFRVEEDILLPALRAAGEVALADRTAADHGYLRALAAAAAAGRSDGVAAFAERLTEHVRFEERELFPTCEARLSSAILDAIVGEELDERPSSTPAKGRGDFPTLPSNVQVYRTTDVFDETTLPAGLRRVHTTRAGVWGRVEVLSGRLRFVMAALDVDAVIEAGGHGIIPPEVEHHVEPLGPVRMRVAFLRASSTMEP